MIRALLIALGGALGALARYGIGLAIGTRSFPWATFTVNVTGAFALGYVLAAVGTDRWSTTWVLATTVGFLGSFTTFSTFAFETTELTRAGRGGVAAGYIAASVVVAVTASAAGYVVGRVGTS